MAKITYNISEDFCTKILTISLDKKWLKTEHPIPSKPKLFFIQACRGHGFMDGWEVVDQRDDDSGDDSGEKDSESEDDTIEVPDIPE